MSLRALQSKQSVYSKQVSTYAMVTDIMFDTSRREILLIRKGKDVLNATMFSSDYKSLYIPKSIAVKTVSIF